MGVEQPLDHGNSRTNTKNPSLGLAVANAATNGDILEHIGRLNRYRRVAINTIAVGQTRRGRSLMRKLAEQNWGSYVEK